MCKSALGYCSELGLDHVRWSRRSPLPPPAWFDEELPLFANVVKAAAPGAAEEARIILTQMRSDGMREWFDVHAQNIAWHRARAFNVPRLPRPHGPLDSRKEINVLEKRVFQRDGFRCRYCGLRLIAKEVLSLVQRVVGRASFCAWGSNPEMHGAAHAFRPYADHVVPLSQEGRTNMENLVTACGGCNSGKFHYTVKEIGLDDPRDRLPCVTTWDGLCSFLL